MVFAATPDLEVLREVLSGLMRQIHAEYAETDPGMEMVLERADAGKTAWTTEADSRRLLDFLYLLPVGAQKRTAGKYEQVEGSFNLSILQFQNGTLDCDLVCRSNYPVSIEELWQTAQAYGEQFHVDGRMTMDYAGYHVPTDSPLIRLWDAVYRENTGQALGLTYMHSALDAGTICERLGISDMIVVMPTVLDVHTPQERMNVDSFCRTYEYLKQILIRT